VPGDYATIQDAVDAVDANNLPSCTIINLAAGTYVEHVTIARNLTLRGDGQDRTIVDGGGSGPVFMITNPGTTVTIKGVTIQGGVADVGGGIYNVQATLTLENCTLAGNEADVGGGIYNDIGTLTLTNSTLTENTASRFGGGILNDLGSVTLTRVTFQNNMPDDCFGCP
jgi:nitrous oxidase accessory protein NosD